MYDLDDVQKDEEGEDIVPDFMKPEDVKADEGDAGSDVDIEIGDTDSDSERDEEK
jgi:hypothetical protein